MSRILIEFVADSSGLATGVDDLEKIGLVDKQNAEQFKKTKGIIDQYTKSVKDASGAIVGEQSKIRNGIDNTNKSLEGLNTGFKNLGKTALGDIGAKTIKQLNAELQKASTGVQGLNILVKEGKNVLANAADKGSEEYRKLAKEVQAAESVLNSVANDQEKITSKIRQNTQAIIDLENAMAKLRAEGQQDTTVYQGMVQESQMLTAETAELKDQLGDLKGKLAQLSQDNVGFQALTEGAATFSASMQVAQGITVLLGEDSKEFQETLLKLNGIMAVTQGLQQISNTLLDQSVLKTYLQTAGQKLYNVVIGESIGLTAAFRVSLALLSGAGIIAGIYLLVKALSDSNEELKAREKAMNDAKAAGAEFYASETTKLSELLLVAKDKNLSDKTRNEAFKQLNELYPEYLSNLNKDNIGLASSNELIKKQTELIQKLAILKGSSKVLEDIGKKLADIMTQSGDASAVSRFTTALNSGFSGIFMSADEASKKFRSNQQTELSKQFDNVLALQKKYLEELDKAGFGDQALKALGLMDDDATKDVIKKQDDTYKKMLEQRRRALEDEIAILETNKIELRDNRKEVLKIDEDLIVRRAELAKVGETSLAKIGLIDSQTVQAINDLHDAYYKAEMKRIRENEESFRKAELAKQEAAGETNKLLQKQFEENIKLSKVNLDKQMQFLSDANKERQKAYEEDLQKRQDLEKQVINQAFAVAQKISDGIFAIKAQERQQELADSINQLEKAKNIELANNNLTEEQKKRINERYQKEELELKRKAFNQDQNMKAVQAGINAALAVTMAFAQLGPIAGAIASAGILATMAIEIAAIKTAKFPGYKHGTEFVEGPGDGKSDSITAKLSKGERVVDAETNKKLLGIPNKLLPSLLTRTLNLPMPKIDRRIVEMVSDQRGNGILKQEAVSFDYKQMAKEVGSEIAKHPKLSVNMDKNGFSIHLQEGNTITEILNNNY